MADCYLLTATCFNRVTRYTLITRTYFTTAFCRPLAALGAPVIFVLVPRAYALGYGAAVPGGTPNSLRPLGAGNF